jgi:hypothetical protein
MLLVSCAHSGDVFEQQLVKLNGKLTGWLKNDLDVLVAENLVSTEAVKYGVFTGYSHPNNQKDICDAITQYNTDIIEIKKLIESCDFGLSTADFRFLGRWTVYLPNDSFERVYFNIRTKRASNGLQSSNNILKEFFVKHGYTFDLDEADANDMKEYQKRTFGAG